MESPFKMMVACRIASQGRGGLGMTGKITSFSRLVVIFGYWDI
jgi:hypothetical protein